MSSIAFSNSAPATALSGPEQAAVVGHYRRFGDVIAATFSGIPITTVYLPDGFDGAEERIGQLHKPVPASIPTIDVTTRSGTHAYIKLTADSLLWRAHAYGIGFESWSPLAQNPAVARFGRIAIEPSGNAPLTMLRSAVEAVLAALGRHGLGGAIVLDGPGVVIWIPFDDAPDYVPLRAWLHSLIDETMSASPHLFETARNDPPNRIRLSVRTNAPGLGTSLPYSLRCLPGLPVVTPITRDELSLVDPETVTIETAAERLDRRGDVFAAEIQRIGSQRFAGLVTDGGVAVTEAGPVFEFVPRAEVIQIAYEILCDGRPRSADQIIDDATARGLWPADKSRKYLYVMLKMYVEKTLARGRAPLIVQDPDRRFRLNHAPDDNPDPKPVRTWVAPTTLIERLRATATGDDTEAFELAVCAALEPLGFKTVHIGGTANPDGYADAILGPLGYRFMIECKTSSKAMQRPDIFEASKYREQFGAQHAILIAPAFGDDKVIADECATHGVSAWSIDDLCRCLELGIDALELRPMLEPGIAENARAEIEWQRSHGPSKRAAVVCDGLVEAGWNAQVAAADFHAPADSPLLTEDAGMMLVDEYLRTHGSHTPCSRAEIQAAFAYLTHPRVGRATWTDASHTAIVILLP
jgi:bifunctional non-homologous end joining protein LigD